MYQAGALLEIKDHLIRVVAGRREDGDQLAMAEEVEAIHHHLRSKIIRRAL